MAYYKLTLINLLTLNWMASYSKLPFLLIVFKKYDKSLTQKKSIYLSEGIIYGTFKHLRIKQKC